MPASVDRELVEGLRAIIGIPPRLSVSSIQVPLVGAEQPSGAFVAATISIRHICIIMADNAGLFAPETGKPILISCDAVKDSPVGGTVAVFSNVEERVA